MTNRSKSKGTAAETARADRGAGWLLPTMSTVKELFAADALIDPDCKVGKHQSCVGDPCECSCHGGDAMTTHSIDVDTNYVDALLDGRKTFEVRKNDRGYQVGDYLLMKETGDPDLDYHWSTYKRGDTRWCSRCRRRRYVRARISYVYSGDPRWVDLAAGVVVLALDGVEESLEVTP